MTSRRLFAVLWLVLTICTLGAPLLADGCDEACDVHCGDCVWCPLNAEMQSADSAVAMICADVPALSTRNADLVLARALDHVPLAS